MQIIRISEDVVEIQEVSEIKRARLPDFYDALVAQRGFSTPVLPQGTVHYAVRSRSSVYTVAIPPARRKITFREREGRAMEFALPFPWTIFIVAFTEKALDQVRVHFSPAPIRSTEDDLFHAPLPNRYPDGLVCMGSFKFEITSTLPDKVEEAVRFYLESSFTDEILDSINNHMPDEIRAKGGRPWLEGWSLMADEEFPRVRWKKHKPLADVIDQAFERR